ncbi:membrane protein YczE [Kribbella deserti]|uniref:YitT family protein n=1 Tax=Kribbella deserti TaxID=1926257 RepID=A0ABV6QST1_9ACTN
MTATAEAPPPSLNPIAQLTAGRLTRRLIQLYLGLACYGISLGLMVHSHLGLAPWGVLDYGIARHIPLTIGQVGIAVSFLVLLTWIPLRQWPGLGTISNAIVIGLVTDLTLWALERPDQLWIRIAFLVVGIVGNGLATAMYIGAEFGPGPRDGLMTGLVRRTGLSVRLIRTSIEVTVLAIGFALGGVVGLGTVAYALAVGPLVQVFLPHFRVRL